MIWLPIFYVFVPISWFLSVNIMNLVFLTFRGNLFALNHTVAFSNSKFAWSNNWQRSWPDTWKVESSANKSARMSLACGRSLIKIRKSIWPKTEPCGTPHLILALSESLLLHWQTASFLLKNHDKLGCASVKLLVWLEFAKTLSDFIIKKKIQIFLSNWKKENMSQVWAK